MKAKWITASPVSDQAALYVFSKRFTVTAPVTDFTVRISADTRYRLFINGRELSRGPCQSGEQVRYYEELSCGDALICGENEITVQVLHLVSPYFYTTAYHEDKPALWFEGRLSTADGVTAICSDETFTVRRRDDITFTGRSFWSIPPFEVVLGEPAYTELACRVLYVPQITPEQPLSALAWGSREKYTLEKRPIPLFHPQEKRELKVVRTFTEDDRYNIILDAGSYTTAMVSCDFQADAGTELRLIYAECVQLRGDDGRLYKDMRDDPDGIIVSDAVDTLFASGDAQTHSFFQHRAFRFIRVECSSPPRYCHVFAARYTYDFEQNATNGGVGSFECSDERYMQMWNVSRNTLECTTHELMVDCAFYEQQEYVGDVRFEANYAWRLSNDSAMQRKVLIDTVQSQQADGQIRGNYPNYIVQILNVSSYYFIYLLREYLRFTGDTDFARQLTGVCDRVLGYYEQSLTAQGLVLPRRGCRFLDWVASWDKGLPNNAQDTPLTVESLMYAAALNDAAEICSACGRHGLAAEYRERAGRLIAAVNALCYDTEAGLYIDGPGLPGLSEHANVWAILAGAVTGDAACSLAQRMMTRPDVARCSFSKHYDTLRAFEKASCYDLYAAEILSQWEDMLDRHCTTWCESLSFPRSECHGWSCIPMYEMSAMVLGVYPTENGFGKVRIRPHTLGLDHARGRVPMPCGWIDVDWRKADGIFSLEVSSSRPVEMEIICPGGRRACVLTDHYAITE